MEHTISVVIRNRLEETRPGMRWVRLSCAQSGIPRPHTVMETLRPPSVFLATLLTFHAFVIGHDSPVNPLEGVSPIVSWDGSAGEATEWPVCELGGSYSRPHKVYCDRYFTCQSGQPYLGQCLDGYGFVLFTGCRLLHQVDCGSRKKLQAPKGRGVCERLFGIYADPINCNRFYKCDNGTAVPDSCPQSLVFDNEKKECKKPTQEEVGKCESNTDTSTEVEAPPRPSSSMRPVLFKCPEHNALEFGDHSRHPYPGNCHFFIMCLRDGTMKVGSCEPKTAYNPVTSNCDPIAKVSSCKDNI